MGVGGRSFRQRKPGHIRELSTVELRPSLPLGDEPIEFGQLDYPDGSLKIRHPVIESEQIEVGQQKRLRVESAPEGVVVELDNVADGPRVLREVRPPSLSPIARKPTQRPLISLRESALLVNGHRDYQIGSEVARELESADQVDLLSAFVRFAGLRLVRDQLGAFVDRGGKLRVITSVYTGSTEKRALDAIVAIG